MFPNNNNPKVIYSLVLFVLLSSIFTVNSLFFHQPTAIKASNTLNSAEIQTKNNALITNNTTNISTTNTANTQTLENNYNNKIFATSDDEKRFIKSDEIDELVDANGKGLFIKEPTVNNFLDADFRKLAFEHSNHIVDKDESIWAIAKGYGISVDSIISVNNIRQANSLKAGQKIKIPQFSGIYYKVKLGDTLIGLSKRYRTPIKEIARYNKLPSHLKTGSIVFFPTAELSNLQKSKIFGTLFSPPIKGIISSSYGLRQHPVFNKTLFHTGTDIAAKMGKKVHAIADGLVTFSGHNASYGNYIVVQHVGKYESLYAHLSKLRVKKGARIKRGTVIGNVGSSGISTGPHLHLEIKKNKRYINPETFFNFKKSQKLLVYAQ